MHLADTVRGSFAGLVDTVLSDMHVWDPGHMQTADTVRNMNRGETTRIEATMYKSLPSTQSATCSTMEIDPSRT